MTNKNDVVLKHATLSFLDIDKKYMPSDDDIDNLIYNLNWTYPLSKSRAIYNMGQKYEFANIKTDGNEFDDSVLYLMYGINKKYGFNLNSCLLNYYPNGDVVLGHHRDNCNTLHGGYDKAIVVSASFYCTRKMEFLSIDKREKVQISLDHGDILLMGAGTQKYYTHGIIKEKKDSIGHRLNLTFREFIY